MFVGVCVTVGCVYGVWCCSCLVVYMYYNYIKNTNLHNLLYMYYYIWFLNYAMHLFYFLMLLVLQVMFMVLASGNKKIMKKKNSSRKH